MKNVEVNFPLIEDITMEVANKYGMMQPGESNTKAVRAVFFIDPKGIIRAMIYYPLSLGRNFDELKRVVIALQTADNFGVAMPADWRPGDAVIVPPAGSCGVAKDRMEGKEEGVKCYDWFFCTKELSKEKVEDKVFYHGTNANFETFKTDKGAIFLTPDAEFAATFETDKNIKNIIRKKVEKKNFYQNNKLPNTKKKNN